MVLPEQSLIKDGVQWVYIYHRMVRWSLLGSQWIMYRMITINPMSVVCVYHNHVNKIMYLQVWNEWMSDWLRVYYLRKESTNTDNLIYVMNSDLVVCNTVPEPLSTQLTQARARTHTQIYIYIYIERERERERDFSYTFTYSLTIYFTNWLI